MPSYSKDLGIRTKGENHILDISSDVAGVVTASGMSDGLVCVFVPGSTGAITTLEFEPGLLEDLPSALELIAPKGKEFKHHVRWQDGNGRSHVKAAILGPGITVPFRAGKMLLGTWQQIVFIELDVRPRERQIHIQIIGE